MLPKAFSLAKDGGKLKFLSQITGYFKPKQELLPWFFRD
jgi:hypothetical protein